MNETTTKLADGSFSVTHERTQTEEASIRAALVKSAYADFNRAMATFKRHGGPMPWSPQFPEWYDGVVAPLRAEAKE